MSISAIVGRLLQAVEFFRSGFGRWFAILFEKFINYKFFALPLLLWGVIRLTITLFSMMCDKIRELVGNISTNALQVGGVDILAVANTVFPVDETIALIVAWAGVYAVCATIRFIRAAWSAVPLKAS